MNISVVIPTYKRPAMLRAALESVRNQSRPDCIRDVIVSENSDDPGSRRACEEFPELPIRLSYHPAEIPPRPYAHFAVAVAKASGDWVALLADDDIWGRYHIEEACRALTERREAVAFFGNAAVIVDDTCDVRGAFSIRPHIAMAGSSQGCREFSVWETRDMLFETLLHVPLPMWSVVTRKATALAAMEHFHEPVVGMDADRYFIWRVGSQGPVVVGREITYLNRMHDSNDVLRFIREQPSENLAMAAEYTRRMLSDARRLGIDPLEAWRDIADRLPPSALAAFLNHDPWILKGAFDELTRQWGPGWDRGLRHRTRGNEGWRGVLREMCPPFFWRALLAGRRSFAAFAARSMS